MSVPARWRIAERSGRDISATLAPVIIGGCGSSGTTLLRHRLNRHRLICCGPESTLFLPRITGPQELAQRFGLDEHEVRAWQGASPTRLAFIERFQAACLAASGKSVWADKTPENIRRFDSLAQRLPNARFVHVVRDGRDVVCSLREARWMKLEKITGGAERASPEALGACARYWSERVRAGRRLAGSPRYCEVRYEDLVLRPEPTLRKLLEFIGLPWDGAVLEHETAATVPARGALTDASIGRWAEELRTDDLAVVAREAGRELGELGYDAAPERRCAKRRTAASTPKARLRDRDWKAALKSIRRDALAAWLALRDPRLPGLAKLATGLASLYLIAPFDLIPDRIPVFGYLDDAVALAAAIAFALKIAPEALWRELRYVAALRLSRRVWAA